MNKLRRRNFPSGHSGRERLFVPTNSREGGRFSVEGAKGRRKREGCSRSFSRFREEEEGTVRVSLPLFFLPRHTFFSLPRFYYSRTRCDSLCAHGPIVSDKLLFDIIALSYCRPRRPREDVILMLDYCKISMNSV